MKHTYQLRGLLGGSRYGQYLTQVVDRSVKY